MSSNREESGNKGQAVNVDSDQERTSSAQCVECKHFQYFVNPKGHNSPHALGECLSEPWDGNNGQWAMLQHPCKNFVARQTESSQENNG